MDWPTRSLKSRIVWVCVRFRRWYADRRAAERRIASDDDVHARRAQAEAEIEEHDIDDMLDAIIAYRRARARRDVGEELAQELLRDTRAE